MNDLIPIAEHHILVQEGKFELVGFNELSKQVEELGQYLCSIEVTPENIRENKRLVAQVRKVCDTLNRERIEFKKQYLRPYDNLERQIKELTGAVSEYESVVRDQIREIEERERDEKRRQIKELFHMRQRPYGSDELFPFSSFFKDEYLNKSVSLNKVEVEMVAWFERRQSDINILCDYAERLNRDKSDLLSAYARIGDLNRTLEEFNESEKRKETIRKEIDGARTRKGKKPEEGWCVLRIREKDKAQIGQLLTISGFEYEIA